MIVAELVVVSCAVDDAVDMLGAIGDEDGSDRLARVNKLFYFNAHKVVLQRKL